MDTKKRLVFLFVLVGIVFGIVIIFGIIFSTLIIKGIGDFL
jgi:hypothetical protein